MSHYPDTGTVAESIFMLEDHRSQLNDDLAILSMLHIALKVREALPGAAEIVLARSGQEPALVPSGQYLAADGTRLDAPDGLDDVIMFSCGNLNDQTEGTWMPFVSGVAPGGLYRLKIDDLLAACETGPAGRSLTARRERQAKRRRAIVTVTLDVEVYAGGYAEEAHHAIRDHLRVTSAGETILHLAGQTRPHVQDVEEAA
jgi:hypothetical protein